jgi:hypothetical protein
METALAIGAAGFVTCVASTAVVLRLAPGAAPSRAAVLLAVVVGGATLGVAAATRPVVAVWPLVASYSFLSLVFLLAFGAIYKSISLRILGDLLRRPGRRDSYDAILGRYIEEESYRTRLALLVSEGLARREAAGFTLTARGERLARAVSTVQRLSHIGASG